MTLADLIDRLRQADRSKVVPVGFGAPHSYRGYYAELAFEIRRDVTVASMLEAAESAMGATYEGWKGGDYTMGDYSDVYLVVEEGCCGEEIGPVLLDYMLGEVA